MWPIRLATNVGGICGSAREFVETANWRRLERFALPGMAGLRIPALHGRSEELPAESSAGPESLDYWTSRMVALGGYRSNPLFNSIIGTVCPFRNAPCEPSHHPIKWRVELLPAHLRPPMC